MGKNWGLSCFVRELRTIALWERRRDYCIIGKNWGTLPLGKGLSRHCVITEFGWDSGSSSEPFFQRNLFTVIKISDLNMK